MAQNMTIWTLFPVYVHVCVRENFQYSHQNDHFDSEVALLLPDSRDSHWLECRNTQIAPGAG